MLLVVFFGLAALAMLIGRPFFGRSNESSGSWWPAAVLVVGLVTLVMTGTLPM